MVIQRSYRFAVLLLVMGLCLIGSFAVTHHTAYAQGNNTQTGQGTSTDTDDEADDEADTAEDQDEAGDIDSGTDTAGVTQQRVTQSKRKGMHQRSVRQILWRWLTIPTSR